jgi:dTDP-4-dehydrorhamnose reductase
VAGAEGQLGASIVRTFADCGVAAYHRGALDVANPEMVARVVRETAPDLIVNCSAFNDVDGAEERAAAAFDVNAFAVRSLARAADACGAMLVHYSTDFVFDGETDRPYDERSQPAPRSVYAMSKLVGEWFALEAERAFVLRVESLFGTPRDWPGRRSSLDGIVAGLEAGRPVRVFGDRIVSPSYVEDVSAATRHLVTAGSEPGLYHCVNSGHGSWLAVAEETARLMGVAPNFEVVSMREIPLKAARPRFCALSNRKLADAGFVMPPWQDALGRWLAARDRPIK